MGDVFISYARNDREFVRTLTDALVDSGSDPWVDWEDIAPSTEWWEEIKRGIEGADSFLMVVSPSSIASHWCNEELTHAEDLNKRIVPVVHEPVDPDEAPDAIRRRHWLTLDGDATFAESFEALVGALRADHEWVQAHTHFLEKAQAWVAHGRDASFLLRGTELANANRWLASAEGRDPQPAPVHYDYALASGRSATRRQRRVISGVLVALGVAVVLAIVAFLQRNQAVNERQTAVSRLLAIKSRSALETRLDEALRLSVEAYATKRTPEARDSVLVAAQRSRRIQFFLTTGGRTADAGLSSDGRTLAAATSAGAAVWDLERRRFVGTLTGAAPLSAVAVSANGRLLAAVGFDGQVVIMDLARRRTIARPLEKASHAFAVAFAPGQELLAIGTQEGEIGLWHPERGLFLRRRLGPERKIFALAFTVDGKTLAAATPDGVAVVGTAPADDRPVRLLREPTLVQDVAVGARGQIAAVRADGSLVLWRPRGGVYERTWSRAEGARSVAVSAGGAVAVGGITGGVTLVGGPTQRDVLLGHGDEVTAVAFADGGRTVASVSADGLVAVSSTTSARLRRTLPMPLAGLTDLAWTGGGVLAAAGYGQVVTVDGPRSRTLDGAPSGLVPIVLAASPSSRLVAAAGGDGVVVWKPRDGGLSPMRLPAQAGRPLSLGLHGNLVAAGNERGEVALWDLRGRAVKRLRTGGVGEIRAVDFGPDASVLAAGAADGKVVVFDLERGEHSIVRPAGAEGISVIAVDPAGEVLVTGVGKTAIVWELRPPHRRVASWTHDAPVTDLAFAPDGRTVAASDEGGEVVLWDVRTHSRLGDALEVGEPAEAVDFRADGRALTAGARSGRIVLWERAAWDPAAAAERVCSILSRAPRDPSSGPTSESSAKGCP